MDDVLLEIDRRVGVINDHRVDENDEVARALHAAAASGDIPALAAVLAARGPGDVGVDVDGTHLAHTGGGNTDLETALNAAVRGGHVDAACLLLALGASPDADVGLEARFQPVLHTALSARPLSVDLVRLLLGSGADPNRRAFRNLWGDGVTGHDRCSHEALFRRGHAAFDQAYLDALDLLIAYGYDIHALPDRHSPRGRGQRYLAVFMAELGAKFLKEAIDRGAAVPEKELAVVATERKDTELIKYLVLDLGLRDANIDMLARLSTWRDIAKPGDAGGRWWLGRCLPSIDLLLETLPEHRRQEMPTVLCAVVQDNNIDCARFWLDRGVDVNGSGVRGMTPLMEAAFVKADQDVFELLLERGADVNARAVDGRLVGNDWNGGDVSGYNALHFALGVDYALEPTCLKLLLSAGVDVDARSDQGDTPLLVAAREIAANRVYIWHKHTIASLRAFLDVAKDINAVDRHGNTALHLLACTTEEPNRNYLEGVVTALVQRGIDTEAKDGVGKTAGDLFLQQLDVSLESWIEKSQEDSQLEKSQDETMEDRPLEKPQSEPLEDVLWF
ncbi:hypothetical protein RB595_010063 [Gaeumannomyces hyphopodioides]